MKLNRRNFLNSAGLISASTLATGTLPTAALAEPAKPRAPRIQLGICSYCYWHLDGPKFPIASVMDKAAALGVAGVDILHRQMELPEREPLTTEHRAYLRQLKRHAFHSGVAPVCLSTHQTFLSPDPAVITANVEHTQKCIEICYELGIPSMRINTGRWGTIDDFDELYAGKFGHLYIQKYQIRFTILHQRQSFKSARCSTNQ